MSLSLAGPIDLEENDDRGERSAPPVKRPRRSGSIKDKQMELLQEMHKMLERQNEKIEYMHRENQELRKKLSFLTADIRFGGYLQHSPAPRMLSGTNYSFPLRLHFVNSCCNDKYSTRIIEADDKNPLKVAIYDHNNMIIKSEPFSSMRVHIVAIHGDFDDDHKGRWTEEYFRCKIVTGRPGKECLLSGTLYFRLQDGVGYLNNAKFQDNSSFVPSKRFKLGVMAADERISERIQEGITESFAVKDIRGFSTKKSCDPSPHDAVYKLSRIAMNGDRHKSLEQNGIKTVEDLLCSYRKSPDDLRKIMGKISEQDWDKIISHAHKCKPRAGIYYSCTQESNVSQEHEQFSRSNDSDYLKGSSSLQQNPTIQKQLDGQLTHQQIYPTFDSSSSAPSQNVPKEFDDNSNHQVTSVGNELLPVPSMKNNTSKEQHGQSLPCKRTPEEPGSPSETQEIDTIKRMEEYMSMLETALLEDGAGSDFYFRETSLGGDSNILGHSGLSSVNEACNMSYGRRSPASEAGSAIYGGFSTASEGPMRFEAG